MLSVSLTYHSSRIGQRHYDAHSIQPIWCLTLLMLYRWTLCLRYSESSTVLCFSVRIASAKVNLAAMQVDVPCGLWAGDVTIHMMKCPCPHDESANDNDDGDHKGFARRQCSSWTRTEGFRARKGRASLSSTSSTSSSSCLRQHCWCSRCPLSQLTAGSAQSMVAFASVVTFRRWL